ncbi:hypothetical protein OH77DRAFT_1084177 [Trametes cingulata]|nr:hypothetical protein OH77DRAFT_1084177 [Trametes cingulata]
MSQGSPGVQDNVAFMNNNIPTENVHLSPYSNSPISPDNISSMACASTDVLVALPAQTTVSCTMIRCSPDWDIMESIFLSDLQIAAHHLARRSTVHAIKLGTLLDAIYRMCTLPQSSCSMLHPWLHDEVTAEGFLSHTSFATTRVLPAQGSNPRLPHFGFRSLLAPQSLESTANHSPPPPASPVYASDSDVLAVDDRDAATQEFVRIWEPMGLCPARHFILYIRRTDPPVLPSMLDLLTNTHQYSMLPTPQDQMALPDSHATAAIPLELSENHLGIDTQSPNDETTAALAPFVSDPDTLLAPTTSIELACTIRGIPRPLVNQAGFCRRHGQQSALLYMVHNHAAIVQVLRGLGLDPGDLNSTITYRGGLMLSCRAVLDHFGWAYVTYDKRWKVYEAASAIAACEWPETLVAAPQTMHLREVWSAIRLIWGQNRGLLDYASDRPPVVRLSHRRLEAHYTALQDILGVQQQ